MFLGHTLSCQSPTRCECHYLLVIFRLVRILSAKFCNRWTQNEKTAFWILYNPNRWGNKSNSGVSSLLATESVCGTCRMGVLMLLACERGAAWFDCHRRNLISHPFA